MIKAVIFDCFGVLAGSAYKEIYRQAGGDLEKDTPFLDDILTAANQGFMSSEEMNQQVAEHLGISPEQWRETVFRGELPNEELLTYVEDLRRRGYKTAILSNANVGTLQRRFSEEQLALFDAAIASAEVHYIKPEPEIYTLTAKRLGVEPHECVFTDDSPHYAEAATAVGMKGIQYQDLNQFKRDLEALLSQS